MERNANAQSDGALIDKVNNGSLDSILIVLPSKNVEWLHRKADKLFVKIDKCVTKFLYAIARVNIKCQYLICATVVGKLGCLFHN